EEKERQRREQGARTAGGWNYPQLKLRSHKGNNFRKTCFNIGTVPCEPASCACSIGGEIPSRPGAFTTKQGCRDAKFRKIPSCLLRDMVSSEHLKKSCCLLHAF